MTAMFHLRVGWPTRKRTPESPENQRQNVEWLKRSSTRARHEAIHTSSFFETRTFCGFPRCSRQQASPNRSRQGIMPVTNWKSARNFATRCGAACRSHWTKPMPLRSGTVMTAVHRALHRNVGSELVSGRRSRTCTYTRSPAGLTRAVWGSRPACTAQTSLSEVA